MYPFKILNKKKYALCFLNAFIENICIYTIPIVLSIFLTEPFTLQKFKLLIIFIISLKVLEIMLNMIWNMIVEPFLEHTKKDLQVAYFKRVYNLNIPRINSIHSGFLKKQIDTICDETTILLNEIMLSINGFVIAISIFLLQVYRQSINIFIICIIFIIVIVIYNVIISKKNTIIQSDYNKKMAKYNATYVDFLQNIKSVKRFEALKYGINTINLKFNQVKKDLKKVNVVNSFRYDGINAMVYIIYFIILISLFIQMKSGENIFNYVVFYSSIFSGLSVELNGIARLFLHFNKFKSANNQIEKIVIEEKPKKKIKNFNNITIKDIEFSYDDENNTAIKIPKFSINKKDKISIIGESGQGKSTFLSLFCRFYKVNDKNYLIDNAKSSKIPDVAYISQETELFDLTIKENLCLGKNISDDTLNEYLKDAGLLNWINDLEKGVDTLVGEKGIKLSAGQKQRLNLIRGILLDKEIYILDEPTSNLDSISEHKIYNMIDKYLNNKTCIIVTHRPKLTEICNKHYYFENKTLLKRSN